MTWLRVFLPLPLAGMAAACVTTSELPLAPNVVRLETSARGALFVGQEGKVTLHRAAELTLAAGYTHFRLEQPTSGSTSQLVGVQSTFSGQSTPFGGYSGWGMSAPVYARSTHVGATVVMFRADEVGARGAFEAAAVLAGK